MIKFIEVELNDGRKASIATDKIIAVTEEKDSSTKIHCLGMHLNNTGAMFFIKMPYKDFMKLLEP